MRKLVVLGMGVCLVLAFASCKSSESAYKKAYEKAKQQELAEPQVEAPVEVTPVVAAPVTTPKVADTSGVRQEKVTVVSGNDGLKDYSVVAGSFGVKANAEVWWKPTSRWCVTGVTSRRLIISTKEFAR